MTQKGFEDFIYNIYDPKNGTCKSYITAIRIIDEMIAYEDAFGLKGKSITCINDTQLLMSIADYIHNQQSLFKKNKESIFKNINQNQRSYPQKGFCSAAINKLVEYHVYEKREIEADKVIYDIKKGTEVSKKLSTIFDLNKKGKDKQITTTTRIGQRYFRKMILENYESKCCVTGLNIPQLLRASHIVAWSDDKIHRMDPENGLCLSATYDAAFDSHLISFDDDYCMIVSKKIKDFYSNEVVNEYFSKFEGKPLTQPQIFMPSKKLLEKHRSLLVG